MFNYSSININPVFFNDVPILIIVIIVCKHSGHTLSKFLTMLYPIVIVCVEKPLRLFYVRVVETSCLDAVGQSGVFDKNIVAYNNPWKIILYQLPECVIDEVGGTFMGNLTGSIKNASDDMVGEGNGVIDNRGIVETGNESRVLI